MNDIAVIAPFLDFDNNPLRVKGFMEFKKGLEQQGVPFYIIEIFSEGDSPKINNLCNKDNYFYETVFFPIWVRENAINILSSKVPSKYTKLIWMDCDMTVKEDDWANNVSKLLDDHKLVKIGESMSWGGMAAHRDFFQSVGLFDVDFCGMGDYISYLSATKEDLLKGEEEFLDLYRNINLEIYFKILSYRKKSFEYFQGDYTILEADIEKFISNQNMLMPESLKGRTQKSLLLKYIDLERNITTEGIHNIIKIKNVHDLKYPKVFMNYLRSGVTEEGKIYTPDNLGLTSNHSEPEEDSDKTKTIIRELRNLKLAQFEIMQKETELLKVLENQNK
jgi:hypothetical protein|tara:strand:+ start:1376 stop:2377 length:1002 start_codon:yes stop_codon:yes gene_type:complete